MILHLAAVLVLVLLLHLRTRVLPQTPHRRAISVGAARPRARAVRHDHAKAREIWARANGLSPPKDSDEDKGERRFTRFKGSSRFMSFSEYMEVVPHAGTILSPREKRALAKNA